MPEFVACNLCGSFSGTSQPRKASFLQLSSELGICKCPSCELTYQNPRLTMQELTSLYKTHPFYSVGDPDHGSHYIGAQALAFYEARIGRLEAAAPGERTLLGLGCLDGGYILKAAKRKGWEVSGVEFSEELAAYGRRVLEIDIDVTEAWSLSTLGDRKYGAIYSQSLEHVLDPRKTIRQCHDRLHADGTLMLEVPNQFYSLKDQLKYRLLPILGGSANLVFYLESSNDFHTYYFNPATIRQLLSQEGFEVLSLRTYLPSHPVYLQNPRAKLLQDLIYRIGGLFERGPSMEILARKVLA